MPETSPKTEQKHLRLPAGTPIVVFGDDWGRHVSTMQHLFAHVARDYPVIWINAIGHRYPKLGIADLRRAVQKLTGRRASAPEDSSSSSNGAPVSAPRLLVKPRVLPWHGVRVIRALNGISLRRAVRSALAEIGSDQPPFLVTGTPPSAHLVGALGEKGSLYLCMDDFLHLPNVTASMIAPLERELLKRVDAVVATARFLQEAKRPASGRSYYLPQGVNYDHFAAISEVPAALRSLPRPIIGFAGGIGTAVDLESIAMLAARYPQASIVLVGPTSVPVDRLSAPNIHLLGAQPYATLPSFVRAFDVGIIPYVLNEHTRSVDPLKLLEYLAAGIEVVATDLPEVHKYADIVSMSTGREDFVERVGRALASRRDRETLQSFAAVHTWARRAERLHEIMAEVRS